MKQVFKLITVFMLIFIAVSVLTLHKNHLSAAVCLGAAIAPERELIEVYEEMMSRPNNLSATEYGIVHGALARLAKLPKGQQMTGSMRTALTMTQKGSAQNDSVFYDSIILTADERAEVELAVMSEAGCESQAGQRLVAECIYNAAIHDGIGAFGVLERYQYALRDDVTVSESVKDAVAAVFDRGEHITDEPIMFFYNPELTSSRWHETLCYVLTEGRHRFFKLW